MSKNILFLTVLALFCLVFTITGCGTETPVDNGAEPEEEVLDEEAAETGSLLFTANGEEFIREGFTSKDGWVLSFEHAFVTMTNITAYQSNPPYDTSQGRDIGYDVKVEVEGSFTADLAEPVSDPAELAELADVPAGHYNALSWTMARAAEGRADGYSILLIGAAEKEGEIISFTLGFEQEVEYLGGDYIGDERKGIVAPGGTAELEMTFHFDHLFGDYDEGADDEINTEAFGFDPLAAHAVDGVIIADLQLLEQILSIEDYELLLSILTHLAHVGEGHCLAQFVN